MTGREEEDASWEELEEGQLNNNFQAAGEKSEALLLRVGLLLHPHKHTHSD